MFKSKLFFVFCFLGAAVISFYFLKNIIFSQIGNYLIDEDSLHVCDAIFVLGGNSFDRGNKAVELFNNKYADKIIGTGKNIPGSFKAINVAYTEAEVTSMHLQKLGIPTNNCFSYRVGTSTKEEAEAILTMCIDSAYKNIILVTDKFHTHRVKNVFKSDFEKENIDVLVSGAASSLYKESEWWKSEEGLIMVNNEYVKLLYYFIKY